MLAELVREAVWPEDGEVERVRVTERRARWDADAVLLDHRGSAEEARDQVEGDPSAIGRVGELTVGTRGSDGPGEVLIRIRGGTECFLAWSDEPLARGATVLVVETRGPRAVSVVEWTGPSTPSFDLPD